MLVTRIRNFRRRATEGATPAAAAAVSHAAARPGIMDNTAVHLLRKTLGFVGPGMWATPAPIYLPSAGCSRRSSHHVARGVTVIRHGSNNNPGSVIEYMHDPEPKKSGTSTVGRDRRHAGARIAAACGTPSGAAIWTSYGSERLEPGKKTCDGRRCIGHAKSCARPPRRSSTPAASWSEGRDHLLDNESEHRAMRNDPVSVDPARTGRMRDYAMVFNGAEKPQTFPT